MVAAATRAPFRHVNSEEEAAALAVPSRPPTSILSWVLGLGAAALAVGGVIWAVRSKAAKATPKPGPKPVDPTDPTPPPAPEPEPSPWAEIDAMSGPSTQISTEGDGATTSGIPYVWRVYQSQASAEGQPMGWSFSAAVLYRDGELWSSWGDDPDVLMLRPAGSLQKALELIKVWADQH